MEINVEKMGQIMREQGASCGTFDLDGEPEVVAVFLPVEYLQDGIALVERINAERAKRSST